MPDRGPSATPKDVLSCGERKRNNTTARPMKNTEHIMIKHNNRLKHRPQIGRCQPGKGHSVDPRDNRERLTQFESVVEPANGWPVEKVPRTGAGNFPETENFRQIPWFLHSSRALGLVLERAVLGCFRSLRMVSELFMFLPTQNRHLGRESARISGNICSNDLRVSFAKHWPIREPLRRRMVWPD